MTKLFEQINTIVIKPVRTSTYGLYQSLVKCMPGGELEDDNQEIELLIRRSSLNPSQPSNGTGTGATIESQIQENEYANNQREMRHSLINERNGTNESNHLPQKPKELNKRGSYEPPKIVSMQSIAPACSASSTMSFHTAHEIQENPVVYSIGDGDSRLKVARDLAESELPTSASLTSPDVDTGSQCHFNLFGGTLLGNTGQRRANPITVKTNTYYPLPESDTGQDDSNHRELILSTPFPPGQFKSPAIAERKGKTGNSEGLNALETKEMLDKQHQELLARGPKN